MLIAILPAERKPRSKMDLVTVAIEKDLDGIRKLDQLCFPSGDLNRKPAAPDELEKSIAAGQISVVRKGGAIVGFLRHEWPFENHIYISALAVHPNFRGQRVGYLLLENLLTQVAMLDGEPAISTVTAPSNYAMLKLLLSQGFIARRMIRDYFGPGRDRLYCQYKIRADYVDPDDQYLVPAHAIDHIAQLMKEEGYVITSLVKSPTGPVFEVCRFERDDFASLQSDECMAGITFAGSVLAAITFILGFSFVSSGYPDDVRVLLIGAAVVTTFSLIIYANASGELARLRSNVFSYHMKWGNILSEYGGVLPFS
jgi:ribosomal protein S18 acetylase RimI-like enzyme